MTAISRKLAIAVREVRRDDDLKFPSLLALSDKKIETPERAAAIPVVPPDKAEHFENLLGYLGLRQQVPTRVSEVLRLPGEQGMPLLMNPTPNSASSNPTPNATGALSSGATPAASQGGGGQSGGPARQYDRRPRFLEQAQGTQSGGGGGTRQSGTGASNPTSAGTPMATGASSSTAAAFADTAANAAKTGDKKPGWSKRYCHHTIQVEDGTTTGALVE